MSLDVPRAREVRVGGIGSRVRGFLCWHGHDLSARSHSVLQPTGFATERRTAYEKVADPAYEHCYADPELVRHFDKLGYGYAN